MNAVPLPDHSLFDDAAVRAAPTADFFSQHWTEIIDLRARRTNHRPSTSAFADSERFPHTEATDVESVGGHVFTDHPGTEGQHVPGFPVPQRNLAFLPDSRVRSPQTLVALPRQLPPVPPWASPVSERGRPGTQDMGR